MKSIVPYISGLERMSFEEICSEMESHAVREYLLNAPWEKFPYKPVAVVDLAASDDYLFARFFVRGLGLKADFDRTNDPVWQDSCVEVFVADEDGAGYRNFEINCIGAMLSAHQTGRDQNVTLISEADADRVIRYTTVKNRPEKELDGINQWTVVVGIPFGLLGYADRPTSLRANFYKCADGSRHPHYLCWSKVDTPRPDFHRPEFFGTLILDPPQNQANR